MLVAGGGPAGMEAARVAALRGHHVTLCEKSERLGGTAGCLHMATLIYHMGAAAVQGMWAALSRKREGGSTKSMDYDPGILKNSCWLWREDGPFFGKVKRLRGEREKKV